MTDKPIIIDGVDVSECPFYEYQTEEDLQMRYPNSGDCEIGLAGYLFDFSPIQEQLEKHCIYNPNCHYKQLQRAEKQLAQDEEIQVDMRLKIDELNGLLQLKEEEINKLKVELLSLERGIEIAKEIDIYWVNKFKIENDKFKQTLQKIKELADSVAGCGIKCNDCGISGYCADCEDEILQQILQQCKEVLKNEQNM